MEALTRELIQRLSILAIKGPASIIIFLIFVIVGYILKRITRKLSERSEKSKKDILILIGQSIFLGFVVLGIVTSLGTLGINVSALVAGLGLTGFALGFALRDALSNLLAGVLIILYKPFQRGDMITVGGFEGMVTEIDLRYTTLRDKDKKILIPNSTLFTSTVIIQDRVDEQPPV